MRTALAVGTVMSKQSETSFVCQTSPQNPSEAGLLTRVHN
jgi:hypothetical protein